MKRKRDVRTITASVHEIVQIQANERVVAVNVCDHPNIGPRVIYITIERG